MHRVGIALVFLAIMALLAACGPTAGTPAGTPGAQAPGSATATSSESPAPSAETNTPSPTSSLSATPTSSAAVSTASATDTPTPEPEATAPSPEVTAPGETTPAASPTPPELTYDENVKYTPPPPLSLKANVSGQAIALSWSPPPPVTVPHVYSDVIDHYNIFRNQDGGDFSLLGSTGDTSFTDDGTSQPLTAGATYSYLVTVVHEGGVESAQSEKVAVTLLP